MPQMPLPNMPVPPPPSGLTLVIDDPDPIMGSGFTVSARIRLTDGTWFTVREDRWTGLMTDLLTTLAEDVVGAYLYGANANSIGEAYNGVRRLAKAHDRRFGHGRT